MPPKEHLSPDDWIKAAFRALSRGGLSAVRAEALARELEVSKGSFYWHFRDVPALKTAMLGHWVSLATDHIIEELEARGLPADAKLTELITQATGDLDSEYGGATVEGAIREWARCDAEAAEAQALVDGRRVSYLANLFQDAGLPKDTGTQSAFTLYGALIGLSALPMLAQADRARHMAALLALLLHGERRKMERTATPPAPGS